MRSFLILYCSAFAFEQRFLSEVTVYTWSHHRERTVLLTATHWPISLAMGKGTIFSVMLHPAEFPCWSRRRDPVRQHCKLGSSTPCLCSSLTALSPSSGQRKQNSIPGAQRSGLAPASPGLEGSWKVFRSVSLLQTSAREAARIVLGCRTSEYVREPLLREGRDIKSDVPATVATFPFPPNVPEQLQYLNVSCSFRFFSRP